MSLLHCSCPPTSGCSAESRQKLTLEPFQATELVPLQLERLQASAAVQRADILQGAVYVSCGQVGSAGVLSGTYARQQHLRQASACSVGLQQKHVRLAQVCNSHAAFNMGFCTSSHEVHCADATYNPPCTARAAEQLSFCTT